MTQKMKKMSNMEKHRFNNLPEMADNEYRALVENIDNNGYDKKYPIILYEGAILDGWNRYRATQEVGVDPVFEEFEGTPLEALDYVIRSNTRRNLSSSQWACVAIEQHEMIEIIKKGVQGARVDKWKQSKEVDDDVLDFFGIEKEELKGEPTRATAILAEKFPETNQTYIKQIAKIQREMPEVYEQIKKGEKTIKEVQRDIKLDRVKQLERDYLTTLQNESEWFTDINNTDKQFTIIECAPDWEDIAHVANLPIKQLATNSAILFLWCDSKTLPQTFKVIKEWGFQYQQLGFIWVKKTAGGGFERQPGTWTNENTELCIIATKGYITKITNTTNQVVVAEDKGEKPVVIKRYITEMVGELSRITLFTNECTGWYFYTNKK